MIDFNKHGFIYALRLYTLGQGRSHSETNNLVLNFKDGPIGSPSPEQYRDFIDKSFWEATDLFVEECVRFINFNGNNPDPQNEEFYISCMPTSAPMKSFGFNRRLMCVVEGICERIWRAIPVYPIDRKFPVQPAHRCKTRPTHQETVESLICTKKLKTPPNNLLLIDDIVTTGTTFRACIEVIRQKNPGLNVVGLAWARTMSLKEQEKLRGRIP